MPGSFDTMFRSGLPQRDKFLARLFGLFSERVVREWCACPEAPYENLGRPTLYPHGMNNGSTIDFTLRDRITGKTHVAELKCELEYDTYRYLRLTGPGQLSHHTSPAFARFLEIARSPRALDVRCQGKPILVDGAILVWGATTVEGCVRVKEAHGFADVLSLEKMLADLGEWVPASWSSLVSQYRNWTDELFQFLVYEQKPGNAP